MAEDFSIPPEVPVMTLPDAVLFPHAIMPLRIFEPRYRKMLSDVLSSHCLFAVAGLDMKTSGLEISEEPLFRTASIGIVRACHGKKDGTSELFLQGLCRIRIDRIVQENPYRLIAITPIRERFRATDQDLAPLQNDLADLIASLGRMGDEISKQLLKSLEQVKDPDAFIDLASHSLQIDPVYKQRLLETLDIKARYKLLISKIEEELEGLRAKKEIEDLLDDTDQSLN